MRYQKTVGEGMRKSKKWQETYERGVRKPILDPKAAQHRAREREGDEERGVWPLAPTEKSARVMPQKRY